MTSTRSCAALLSIAVIALSSLAHAQTTGAPQPHPAAATDAPPITAPSVVHASSESHLELDDPRGNLALTVLGGVAGFGASVLIGQLVRSTGIAACAERSGGDDADCGYGPTIEGFVVTLALAPWLTSVGMLAGGHVTGGTGGYGWTLLGGVIGALPAIGLVALVSELDLSDDALTPLAICAPVGFIVGAVFGYRMSADDIDASLDIAPDGRGAKLTIGGTF